MATQEKQKNRDVQETTQQQTTGSKQIQTRPGESGTRSSPQTGMTRRGQFGAASASPFAFMRRFSEEMDRLFDDFGFGGRPSFSRDLLPSTFNEFRQSLWSPQIETFEREGQLVIRADLPGLTKDDVNVEINDDAITIPVSDEMRTKKSAKVITDRSARTAVSSVRFRYHKVLTPTMRTRRSITVFLRSR